MEQILDQLPVVLKSLNIGFLQTLKLFMVTLIGAFPLGLVIAFGAMSRFKPVSIITKLIVWIVRGTPLMIQLLIIYYFPGTPQSHLGRGRGRPFSGCIRVFYPQLCLLFLRNLPRRHPRRTRGAEGGRPCIGHD